MKVLRDSDPRFIAKVKPYFSLLEKYFRYETQGLSHIPKRKALVVMNHGIIPFHGFLLAKKLMDRGLLPRGLGAEFLFRIPGLREFFLKGGAVNASPENARRLLREGQVVMLAPGGIYEALIARKGLRRIPWERRMGFVKLAVETGTPIVPTYCRGINSVYFNSYFLLKPRIKLLEKNALLRPSLLRIGPSAPAAEAGARHRTADPDRKTARGIEEAPDRPGSRRGDRRHDPTGHRRGRGLMVAPKRPPPSETYHAVTEDGWKIALHRYRRGGSRLPVLLVHGLASNRHNFDFPRDDISFAKYLWSLGWDTWVVELRGAGRSSRPKWWQQWRSKGWRVDHYILQDLPAAIRFILGKTKKKRLHWVGHSLGGLLVAPFLQTHGSEWLQSAVLAASPVTGVPKRFHKWTYMADPLLKVLPIVPYKTMAMLFGLRPEWVFRGPVPRLFVSGNMDLRTLRHGAEVAVDDLSSRVLLQFQSWMRSKTFHSADRKIRYHLDLKNIRLPILLIAGSHDPFTSVPELRKTLKKLGSRKKSMIVFGKEYGHAADYSHWDLILGQHAPREVYPAIANWLAKHD